LTAASRDGFQQIDVQIDLLGFHLRLFGVQALFEFFRRQPMRRIMIAHASSQGRLIRSVRTVPEVEKETQSTRPVPPVKVPRRFSSVPQHSFAQPYRLDAPSVNSIIPASNPLYPCDPRLPLQPFDVLTILKLLCNAG